MKHKYSIKNILLIVILLGIILWSFQMWTHNHTVKETYTNAWKKTDIPKNTPKGFMCCESPKGIEGVPSNAKFIIKTNNLYIKKPTGKEKIGDECSVHGKFIEYQRNKGPESKTEYEYKSKSNPYCILSKTSNKFTNTFGGNPSCPSDLTNLSD